MYVSAVTHRLLTEGRVDLEGFEQLDRIHPGHRIRMHEQVPYHYYPLGAVVGQVPGVLLAKLLGDMPHEIDAEVQLWNSIFALVLKLVSFGHDVPSDQRRFCAAGGWLFSFSDRTNCRQPGHHFLEHHTGGPALLCDSFFLGDLTLSRKELSRGQQLGFGFLLAAVFSYALPAWRPRCLPCSYFFCCSERRCCASAALGSFPFWLG